LPARLVPSPPPPLPYTTLFRSLDGSHFRLPRAPRAVQRVGRFSLGDDQPREAIDHAQVEHQLEPRVERRGVTQVTTRDHDPVRRSEEHTSELQSRENLVCRLLL